MLLSTQVSVYIHVFDLNLKAQPFNAFLIGMKYDFLRTILDYEHYVPLNLPMRLKVSSLLDYPASLGTVHFLAGLLLKDLALVISHSDDRRAFERRQAITTLLFILWKHDFDPRYQDSELREVIFGMYFPFVRLVRLSLFVLLISRSSRSPYNSNKRPHICPLGNLTAVRISFPTRCHAGRRVSVVVGRLYVHHQEYARTHLRVARALCSRATI